MTELTDFKRGLRLLSTLLLLLTALGCDRQQSPTQPTSGRIHLVRTTRIAREAENVDPGTIEIPMVIQSNPDASGGKCLAVPGGAGKPGKGPGVGRKIFGQASYTVDIPVDGEYVFWGRTFWENGCGNSFGLVVDNGRPQLFNGPTYDAWLWNKGPVVLPLSAGKHTLTIRNREDGVKLDQFLLTTDADYRPVAFEPVGAE